jgi:hypothetical protein
MHDAELSDQRAPAIWFRRRTGKKLLSKLSALPTLPSDVEWPRRRQAGTPLHFLAQIDLSHLPSMPLENTPHGPAFPKSGLLFFFADMVEEMLWGEDGGPFATTRVIFADRGGAEREPPNDMPEVLHAFGELGGGYNTPLPLSSLRATLSRRSGAIRTAGMRTLVAMTMGCLKIKSGCRLG